MDELEVFFCDLCGASVPASDLEGSAAVRLHGKIVGVCCVEKVRPGAAQGGGGSSTNSMLTLLALLVSLAGATIYLEWRFSEGALRSERGIAQLAANFGSQSDRLAGLEARLMLTADQSDLVSLNGKTEALRKVVGGVDGRVARMASHSDRGLEDIVQEIGALRSTLDLQIAHLSDLEERSMRVSQDLAELKALPRAAARASAEDDSMSAQPAVSEDDESLPAEIVRFLPALTDSDAGSRFEAVDELLQIGDRRIFAQIIPLANDSDPFVRRLVVEGLAGYRADPAVDILLLALGDPEDLVRATAATALKKLTGQSIPFDAEASAEQRASMQRRWKQWWVRNRVEFF